MRSGASQGASTPLLLAAVLKPLDSSCILALRASKGAGSDGTLATLWKTNERFMPLFDIGPKSLVNCHKVFTSNDLLAMDRRTRGTGAARSGFARRTARTGFPQPPVLAAPTAGMGAVPPAPERLPGREAPRLICREKSSSLAPGDPVRVPYWQVLRGRRRGARLGAARECRLARG